MDRHDSEHSFAAACGRGWIPAERDIGLPGKALGVCGGGGASILPELGSGRGTSEAGGGVGAAIAGGDARVLASIPLHHPADGSPPQAGLGEDPGRHNGWTPARKARFLDHLSWSGNVRAACVAVGLSHEAAYKLRRRDALFARAWAAALVLARGHAEQVLADRALNGVTEPIFYRGEQVGARLRFDARLLLAHLGRLDRLAEQAEAPAHAARFDELVAVIAGACPDAMLPDADALADVAEADGDEADAAIVPGLPLPRERFVALAADAGERAAASALYDVDEPEDGEADVLPDEDEEEEEWEDPTLVARAAAAAEAAGRWDRWCADACALVDGAGVDRRDDVAFIPSTLSSRSTCLQPPTLAAAGACAPAGFPSGPDRVWNAPSAGRRTPQGQERRPETHAVARLFAASIDGKSGSTDPAAPAGAGAGR